MPRPDAQLAVGDDTEPIYNGPSSQEVHELGALVAGCPHHACSWNDLHICARSLLILVLWVLVSQVA